MKNYFAKFVLNLLQSTKTIILTKQKVISEILKNDHLKKYLFKMQSFKTFYHAINEIQAYLTLSDQLAVIEKVKKILSGS